MGGFGSGDRLARGAKSANFGSMSHVSQERWNQIFGPYPEYAVASEQKPTKQTKRQKNAANSKKAG